MSALARNSSLAAIFLTLVVGRASAEQIYGMTATSGSSTAAAVNLVTFDSATPGTRTTIGAFSGLLGGHTLREIDFRSANNALYAISTTAAGVAQMYTVNLTTAALTPVGSAFALTGTTNAVASMDFSATDDMLRIVTRGGQSYRWNPQTNTFVGADTRITYVAGDANTGNPDLIGISYNNANTLFGWDFQTDSLVRIGGVGGAPSANGGEATSLSNPVTALTGNAGFGLDISAWTGFAYTTHDDPASGTISSFYRINLNDGTETLVGAYGDGVFVNSLTVGAPVPEPATWLAGAGLVGLVFLRRRRAASARA